MSEERRKTLDQRAIDGTIDLDKAIDYCTSTEDNGKGMCIIFMNAGNNCFAIMDPTEETRKTVHVVWDGPEDGVEGYYARIDLGNGTSLTAPIDRIVAGGYCLCGYDDGYDDGDEDDEDGEEIERAYDDDEDEEGEEE